MSTSTLYARAGSAAAGGQSAPSQSALGRGDVWRLALTLLTLVAVGMQIVDAAFPQFRMLMNGGDLGRGSFIVKPLLLAALLANFLTYGFRVFPQTLFRWWLALLGYLGFLVLLNAYRLNTDLHVTALSFLDTYGVALILPLTFSLIGTANEKATRLFLILSFIPLAALGVMQHWTADLIVYGASNDAKFVVNSPMTHGDVRAFSLFSSPLRFGYYISFIAPLGLLLVLGTRGMLKKLLYLIFFVCTLYVLSVTIARNAFIITAEALIVAAAMYRRPSVAARLPLLLLALSAAATLAAASYSTSYDPGSSVLSGDSLGSRLEFWRQYVDRWLFNDPLTALFGDGTSQYSRFNLDGDVVIDNMYIAVGVQIGLIGLFLFCGMLWKMWQLLCEAAILIPPRAAPAFMAGVAVWCTFLAAGVLNTSIPVYIPLYCLFLMLMPAPVPRTP